MNNTTKHTVIFAAVIILVIIGLFTLGRNGDPGVNNQPAAVNQIGVDGTAPDFNLEDLSGKSYTLSQYQGQNPVLLEFFAVWCPHCQNQAKITKEIAEKNLEAGLVALSINSSQFGRFYSASNNAPVTENDLKWFRDQFGAHEPILFDRGAVGQSFGLEGFPMLVLINKDGKIVWSQSGEVSASVLQAEIDKVL